MTRCEPARFRKLKFAAGAVCMAGFLAWLGPRQMLQRFQHIDARWLFGGLALATAQFFVLAARFRFIAGGFGVKLRFRSALGDYYLSTLLNQLLPFGVLGDALRAATTAGACTPRINDASADREPDRVDAVAAVVIDRASGQLVLWIFALLAIPDYLPRLALRLPQIVHGTSAAGIGVCLVCVFGWQLAPKHLQERLFAAARILLTPPRSLVHGVLSAALVIGHIGVFYCATQALDSALTFRAALHVVPLVLICASLPSLFAGFGLREAASAALCSVYGLDVREGATLAVLYGSMGLLASLPGVLALPRLLVIAPHGRDAARKMPSMCCLGAKRANMEMARQSAPGGVDRG